ncbi:MAG TPA: FtsK/SpoIIIE domain-containing protein [Pyrinomonadaceae bacterium]
MQFNRDELAGAVIAERLNNARVGVVVRDLADIKVDRVAAFAADQLDRPLHVAAVDYPLASKPPKLTLTFDIEKAVLWRSQPDLAGQIVVFVQGEKKRLHSLEDLDTVTARDLAYQLLTTAGRELSSNLPQTKFWDALRDEAATFPLSKIEDFVKAVYAAKKNVDAIPDNLWQLGLLKDGAILQTNRDPSERLRRNRELIVEMSQLSEQSRKRMSSVLAKAHGSKQAGLRNAFKDLMEFFRRGGDDILKRLDVATVEQLLRAGRPLPSSSTSAAVLDNVDDVNDNENGEPVDPPPPPPERPLRGRSLVEAVAQLAVRTDKEAEKGLHEFGESYRRNLDNQQHIEEATITPGFGGQTLHPDMPSKELRSFMGYACRADSWGGVLETENYSIREAIRHANLENEFTLYNPEDPSQGVLGQCLFSLLRRFDDYLKPDIPFIDALNRFTAARTVLLKHLDLLLAYPLVLFGGYPDARQALNDYLAAYSKIIHALRQHDATLHSRDANALRYVIIEILRLDVVYIRTPNEWKAILTPLHPFHLWRFREILKAVHSDKTSLNEEEQKQLSKALPDLPHLLHFVIFSSDMTGEKRVELPQAGSYELLPTYENRTNRYLGNDGLDFLSNLLRRWLDYAPYSRPQIRIALVDVPDLRVALKSASAFFDSVPDTRLMIDCHFTRGQNPAGELARFDYDDKDYELAKMLDSGKLAVQLHSHKSLAEVAKALSEQPVHITYLFDQSQYQLGYAPHARQLLVSPLVITYQYEYSETFKRGTIAPSSEADEGLFADFHFLVNRAAHLPPGQQIRLQHEGEMDLESVNTLLQSGATRWLVIGDRVLTPYRLENAVPLSEQRVGHREIAVWTKSSPRAVARFVDLLRQFNLYPDPNVISDLLRRFSHIAAGGLFSVPLVGGARETKEKGLLGTVLAAAWYTEKYPGSLVASLDSNLAQQWLKSRPHSGERADLIGLRINENELVIEPIEVKTRAEGTEARIVRDPDTGRRRLEGGAVNQLKAMLEALGPIFGGTDDQPLFTPARREVLKYQLHRECFREVHDPEWQKEWYQNLQHAFTLPNPSVSVSFHGLVLHVHLEENADVEVFDDTTQPIALVKIGARAVQRLVSQLADQSSQSPPATSSLEEGSKGSDDGPAPAEEEKEGDDHITSFAPEAKSPLPEPKRAIMPAPAERSEVEDLAYAFRRACQSYRIEISECDPARAVVGPTVWRFYVRLKRGQRIDPLRNALEDIGREMRRSGLLVTTIPNSDEIAVDIPRMSRESVPLSRGLSRLPAIPTPELMPIPIGVTPEGNDIIRDLSQMPHLLVGGTTGSGKTVFLYGLLAALLKTHPDPTTLRLLLSTSGPEDFSFFEGLPHLEEGKVIADAREAIELLQTHVTQMFEERQEQLTNARCRDIGDYNNKHQSSPLPPFVVVVDEFADLADQLVGNRAKREAFYTNIRRIAQLGRKRGVHLVLCTQRPSADLVPTNIRNIMNGRVALHVNDATASRMILDEVGAEQLLMRGDLLFKEQTSLIRAQGYYITSDELDHLLQPYRTLKIALQPKKRSRKK